MLCLGTLHGLNKVVDAVALAIFFQLDVDILKTANMSDDSGERAGKVLLAEWAKFRWGVFSESGHQRDPLYPPWYSARPPSWEPNICSDVIPLTHTPACPPHLSPRCPWPQAAVENATSSILAIPQLPKVRTIFNFGLNFKPFYWIAYIIIYSMIDCHKTSYIYCSYVF